MLIVATGVTAQAEMCVRGTFQSIATAARVALATAVRVHARIDQLTHCHAEVLARRSKLCLHLWVTTTSPFTRDLCTQTVTRTTAWGAPLDWFAE